MIKKILKVLGIVALVFCLMTIVIRLDSLEKVTKRSVADLQWRIGFFDEQTFGRDIELSTKLQDLERVVKLNKVETEVQSLTDVLKMESQIGKLIDRTKEVDYNHIIRGDVLVMSLFGSGAGTVVKKTDKEMYVLTCYHVVDDIVKLNKAGMKINAIIGYTLDNTGDMDNLKSFVSFSAEVVKSDEENDLALLKINYSDPNLSEIKIAEVEPQKGDTVYSVGSPLGLLRTVSRGILANKIVGFYLTDGTTTFGNSGGGLYNKNGELIGVPSNVMGYEGGLGKDGKETFIPESSLGLSRDLATVKAFLEGVI